MAIGDECFKERVDRIARPGACEFCQLTTDWGYGVGATGGGDIPGPGSDENDRVLLNEHTEGWLRTDLPAADLPALSDVPPTYAELWERHQILPPGSRFTKDAAFTAARLRELGIEVAPVAGLSTGLHVWGASFDEILVIGDGWGIVWLGLGR